MRVRRLHSENTVCICGPDLTMMVVLNTMIVMIIVCVCVNCGMLALLRVKSLQLWCILLWMVVPSAGSPAIRCMQLGFFQN